MKRVEKTYLRHREEADKRWNDFIAQEPGKAKDGQLSQLFSSLEAMNTTAAVLRDKNTQDEINARLDKLKELLHEHKPDFIPPSEIRKLTAAERKQLISLVSQEELESVYLRYLEVFVERLEGDGDVVDGTEHQLLDDGELSRQANDALGIDLGVDIEKKLPWEALMGLLELDRNAEVLPFMNSVRNRESVFVWTEGMKPQDARQKQAEMNTRRAELMQVQREKERKAKEAGLEPATALDMEWLPLTLLWHQAVGVTAVIRRMTSGEQKRGILFCDEVGLGKTSQTLAIIAELTHLYELAQTHTRLKGYFGKSNKKVWDGQDLPDAPHLVICARSLIENWLNEAKMWLQGFEFFEYSGRPSSRKEWFDKPTGKWAASKAPMRRRIIFASSHALAADSKEYWQGKPRQGAAIGQEYPVHMSDEAENAKGMLHLRLPRLMVVAADEAHALRSRSLYYPAMLRLQKSAVLTMALTATPIYTHPRDLVNLGRAVGIPWFGTLAANEFESQMCRAIKRAKVAEAAELSEGGSVTSFDVAETFTQAGVREAYITWVLAGKEKIGDNIIRRTLDSRNDKNERLSGLPPYILVPAWVRLQRWELDILEELNSDVEKPDDALMMTSKAGKTFYLRHRQGAAQPRAAYAVVHGRKQLHPPFGSLEGFERRGSTKTKTMLSIIQHHIENPGGPALQWDESTGKMSVQSGDVDMTVWPPPKFVVYTEWLSMQDPVIDILELADIKVFQFTGKMLTPKREHLLSEFRRFTGPAVLVMSSVGMTGINLSAAHIMIFMDQLFSEQEKRQLI
ncbi:hypothetical protein OBBRIDRAFT_840284, partial [Obba rivulosa]